MVRLTPNRLLRGAVEMGPDRVAVVEGVRRLTYGELSRAVDETARRLAEAGVGPLHRVVHLGCNSAAHAVFMFATARLGAIYAPLDPWYKLDALHRLSSIIRPTVWVLGRSLFDRPLAQSLARNAPDLLRGATVIDLCSEPWSDVVWSAPGTVRKVYPGREADALEHAAGPHVMLVSGDDDGVPRCIVYSQEALSFQVLIKSLGLKIGPSDRFVNVYQASHYGGATAVLNTAAVGARLIQIPVPHAKVVLNAIASEAATFIVAVPGLWRLVLDHPDAAKTDFSSLRMANIASDFIPEALIEEVTRRTGATSVQGYGLTEVGLLAVLPDVDAVTRRGSAGLTLPFCSLRVMDANGHDAEPGHEGELLVRTRYAAAGRWDGERVVPLPVDGEGFYHTGDLGRRDEEGYLYITGRTEDFMKVSGFRISTRTLEEVLAGHPAVKEAAVFAVPDPQSGQAPVAVVVLGGEARPAARELEALVAEGVMPQAVPVAFRVAGQLLRSEVDGKLRKREMLEQYERGAYEML